MPRPAFLRAALGGLFALVAVAAAVQAEEVPAPKQEAPRAHARLVAEHATLAPGTPTRLGVHLRIDPGWHVYWRNPGDSGTRPRVRWLLPEGFEVTPLRWPAPKRLLLGGLASYAYEDEVLLAATVTPPAGFTGEARIRALAVWLVCEASAGCIPQDAALELTLPVRAAPPAPDPRHATLFRETAERLPVPLDDVRIEPRDATIRLVLPRQPDWSAKTAFTVFPYAWDVVDLAGDQAVTLGPETLTVDLPRAARSTASRVDGVLVARTGETRRAYRIGEAPPAEAKRVTETDWAEAAAPEDAAPVEPIDYESFGGATSSGPSSLWLALLGALVGGLILNLMPCVLPVLSLKVLGFVGQAGDDPKQIRAYGLAFGAGVLAMFWALAGVLLMLRAGGQELGWGFQLQEPRFVAGMAFLFLAMTLNLLGVFEIGLGLMAAAGRVQDRVVGSGLGASFANGALATLIATPCTAPFMGGALGFTLDKSFGVALAVFTALGVGMAAPYVVLAWFPRWLNKLPRPGPWMGTFQKVMAVPLLATALWLVWVFAQQMGTGGALLLLAGLAVAAVGFFLFGRFGDPARRRAVRLALGHGLAVLLVAAGVAVAFSADPPAATANATVADDDFWTPFDPPRIERLRAQGRPVFVDFTADWCLTCKFNEKTFIDVPAIRALAEEHGFVMMKADWTREDPSITRALARFRRGSVPLYVIYRGDPESPPIVLPEAITTSLLSDAMEYAVGE